MNEEQELKAAQKIRTTLADELKLFPSYTTKFSLQRWLEEYKYDVDALIPNLRWTLNTLKAIGVHTMDTSSIEVVNHFVANYSPLAPYFPGGIMSFDREGHVVFIQPLGRIQPARLTQAGRVSKLYRMLIFEAYATVQLVCAQEEKRKKRLGQIAIFDMSGFSRHTIHMPGLKIISHVFGTLQLMFPGVLLKVYVINTSSLIIQSYRLLQIFLTKKTKDAFEFLDDNWCSRLRNELGEENILPHWGGTMEASKPTGDIRMGGEPTQEMMDRELPPEKSEEVELRLLNVPSRRCSVVKANVEVKGQILRWYFTCTGGDIQFYIQKDGREVVPRLMLSTQFYPEFGEIKCDDIGLYELCFDNGHSMLFSRTIAYKIDLHNAE